ncbi:hypothetical protein C9374_008040 [Naegleria lovaniensis]|uniref:Uncharacterized protein n=1 Tax=Naegleria lovaniensis TaxID=51637 RepID=A0AA88GG89_NAELO|nr:uncharacterized protein C9374_008040 [Naegleria lovaniensis]KAG2378892.1 hypothetical protein C9374_008040 [Naegleria lovaniensis]
MEAQFRKSTFNECSYVQQCLLFGMNVELILNLTSSRCLRDPKSVKYSRNLDSLSRSCSQAVVEASIGREALSYTFSKLNKTVSTLEKEAIKAFLKGKIAEACKNETQDAYDAANMLATSMPKDMDALLSMMELKFVTDATNESPSIAMLCVSLMVLSSIALVLYLMIDYWNAVSQESKNQRKHLKAVNQVFEQHMDCFKSINKHTKDQQAQIAKIENYLKETTNERNLLKESFSLQETRLNELQTIVSSSSQEFKTLFFKYEQALTTLQSIRDELKPCQDDDSQYETIEESIKKLVHRKTELENCFNALQEKCLKEKSFLKEENRKLNWEIANNQQKIEELHSLVNSLRDNLETEKSNTESLESALETQTSETIRLSDALNSAEDRIIELSSRCKEFQMDLEITNKALEKIDAMLSIKIVGRMNEMNSLSQSLHEGSQLPTRSLQLEKLQRTIERLSQQEEKVVVPKREQTLDELETNRSQGPKILENDCILLKKEVETFSTFVQSIEDMLGYEDCANISDKCERLLCKLQHKIELTRSQQGMIEEKECQIIEQQKELEGRQKSIESLINQSKEYECRIVSLEDELHNLSTENMKILKNRRKELEEMKCKNEDEQQKQEPSCVLPTQEQNNSLIKVLEHKIEASNNEKEMLQALYQQQFDELTSRNEKLLNDLNSHEMYIMALEKDAKMDTKEHKIMKEQFFAIQHTNELLKKDIFLTNQQYLKIVSKHESALIEKDRELEEAKMRISILEHRVKSLETRCIENQIDITSLSAEKCNLQAEKTALLEENKLHKLARKLSFE